MNKVRTWIRIYLRTSFLLVLLQFFLTFISFPLNIVHYHYICKLYCIVLEHQEIYLIVCNNLLSMNKTKIVFHLFQGLCRIISMLPRIFWVLARLLLYYDNWLDFEVIILLLYYDTQWHYHNSLKNNKQLPNFYNMLVL